MRFSIILFFAGALSAQIGEYAGPSVLSRGGGGGMRPAAPVALRAFLNVSALYGTGMNTGTLEGNRLTMGDGYGGEAAVGLYGYHTWKRTVVGINYRGDYRRYNMGYRNGSDQFLMFGLTHQPNRKISITLREGAGTFKYNAGYMGTFGFYDPTFAQIPYNELLDSRTNYVTTMADVTYLRTPRLSFNVGGTGFQVRRGTSAFYGVTGASVRADTAYRLTRHTTVGADYFFSHFNFNKAFGSADMHSAGLNYSVNLGRLWEVRLRLGAIRVETLGAGIVQLDPVVAAIIGRSAGLRAFYKVRTDPAYNLQISRTFRHALATLGYQYGTTPGNGVYLASRQNTATASYSYTGMRWWSFSAGAYYSDMRSIGQDIGRYQTASTAWSAARSIGQRNLFATFRFEARRYLSGLTFQRNTLLASLGIAYSPGDVPLRLW